MYSDVCYFEIVRAWMAAKKTITCVNPLQKSPCMDVCEGIEETVRITRCRSSPTHANPNTSQLPALPQRPPLQQLWEPPLCQQRCNGTITFSPGFCKYTISHTRGLFLHYILFSCKLLARPWFQKTMSSVALTFRSRRFSCSWCLKSWILHQASI